MVNYVSYSDSCLTPLPETELAKTPFQQGFEPFNGMRNGLCQKFRQADEFEAVSVVL